jgi:uncharacterized membrane protein
MAKPVRVLGSPSCSAAAARPARRRWRRALTAAEQLDRARSRRCDLARADAIPQRGSDFVEEVEDLSVRLQNGRLGIADPALRARLEHDHMCTGDTIARHGREQMMLNLVVESSIPNICERVRTHVPGRQHLTA